MDRLYSGVWKTGLSLSLFLDSFFCSALLISPFIGEDFFPAVDAGQLRLHVKAPSGTRIEVTAGIFSEVENEIKKVIDPS